MIGKLVDPDGRTQLIDGVWRTSESTFDVQDPATLETIGVAAEASLEDAVTAMDAACRGFEVWRRTTVEDRANLLRAASARIRAASAELGALMTAENGKPLGEAVGEVLASARMLDWAAEQGRRANGRVAPSGPSGPGFVLRSPVGPVLAITPWNFPGSMLVRKVGLALAAGCSVIVKPAEQTPLIGTALVRLIAEELPAGVLQSLTTTRPAEVVAPLLADRRLRKISFTGSTEVGLHLVRSTQQHLRRTSLEMGGHSPALVFEGADLQQAAASVVATKFANAGQSCISINRLYVANSVHDQFVELLQGLVTALKVGHGADDGTQVGPLIDFAGLDKVERHVEDAVKRGAKVLAGGRRWTSEDQELRGAFFEPTLLDACDEQSLIASEETFGPVLPVFGFDSEEEAIAKANSTDYGLAAYLYSQQLDQTWRVADALEFGVIGVNEPFPVRPELPFGGMKNSGQDREGGSEGIEAYLESKSVAMRI
jgi:succinate-semialdehyde dehydrogenase/glutarate-semialdehyde dehydrogenase